MKENLNQQGLGKRRAEVIKVILNVPEYDYIKAQTETNIHLP